MTFQAPDETSVNNEEHQLSRYILPFASELIGFILENKKLTTYRFGNKYDYLQIGDDVRIQDSTSKATVATATLTNKFQVLFRDLPLEGRGHEVYRNKEHQRQVLSGYYAYIGRTISDDDLFLVFSFKLTS